MALVIGMDEAGYGPNLGPLVVSVIAWDVPGSPQEFDFWSRLGSVCHPAPPRGDRRLHIADSKAVYSPARGLAALERSVLAACRMAELPCGEFGALWQTLGGMAAETEPWFDGHLLPLPHATQGDALHDIAAGWRLCCEQCGLRLRAVCSDVVLTRRFNRLTEHYGSKGEALTRISLGLLRRVWDPDADGPALVIADKHGGRNRYDVLLHDVLTQFQAAGCRTVGATGSASAADRLRPALAEPVAPLNTTSLENARGGPMVHRLDEGREVSRYRVGQTELRFQTRGERHFPVALASMVSKYVRELAMVLFNRFWAQHVPGLKPTKGYPTDAQRFRRDIAAAQQRLGIPDDVLWRMR